MERGGPVREVPMIEGERRGTETTFGDGGEQQWCLSGPSGQRQGMAGVESERKSGGDTFERATASSEGEEALAVAGEREEALVIADEGEETAVVEGEKERGGEYLRESGGIRRGRRGNGSGDLGLDSAV